MTLPRSRVSFAVVAGMVFLFLVLGGANIYRYYTSTKSITISYKNSHDVLVYDDLETQGDGEKKLVATITRSGETKRLKQYRRYLITYKGDGGFAAGEKLFDLTTKTKEQRINPYFSRAKLDTMLQQELGQVQQAISNKYVNINLYKLQTGQLYHWGDWYGTTLHYVGDDNFNDDTLRAVLHKENGEWILKTTPPDISLSKFLYPNIPEDILRNINKSR